MKYKVAVVRGVGLLACLMAIGGASRAQQLTLQRGAATVVVEAYAPNIVRVTMSLDKARALAAE